MSFHIFILRYCLFDNKYVQVLMQHRFLTAPASEVTEATTSMTTMTAPTTEFMATVSPYCIYEISEELVDNTYITQSNEVKNTKLVQLTHDSFVEKVRFETDDDSTPIGVLKLKETTVSIISGFCNVNSKYYFRNSRP